ncbi:MAG: SapC family protein [Desulfuromonadaceae bacterium]|nr:SapC family protein [Desulfuromonadaceae bacterium]
MSQIVPVTFKNHGQKRLLTPATYLFAEKEGLAPLAAAEFAAIASRFPVVFLNHGGKMAAFALLGLEKGENLFVGKDGRWLSDYIPAFLRRYPFVFGKKREDSEDLLLCIDEESGLLTESDGDPLFTETGEKAPALEKAVALMSGYHQSAGIAEKFSSALQEKELLAPLHVKVQVGENAGVNLGGLLQVDESRLDKLADGDFLELRSKGYLPLVYLHLFSLTRIQDLLARKKARAKIAPKSWKSEEQLGDLFRF